MSKFADIVLFAAALGGWLGCHGRDDLDGRRRPIPGLSDRGRSEAPAAATQRVHYDLVDNRATAGVYASGSLIIDPVRPALATAVEGRWPAATVDGRRAALVDGIGGTLILPVDFDPGGISRSSSGDVGFHIWARPAVAKQLVSVLVNEHRVGDIAMPAPEWNRYSLDIPSELLDAGEVRIRLYFRSVGDIDGVSTAAAISRIALGGKAPSSGPAVEAGAVTRGGDRRTALSVPGPSRLSFYMYVPAGSPRLSVATAGVPTSELEIRVADDRGGAQLWTGTGSSTWAPVTADLSAYAGRAVRLDLISTGPAAWAAPKVVGRRPPEPSKSLVTANHVILWVVSSLRADRLDTPRTPAMSRFANSAARFSAAHTTAGTSGPAHATMMTGRRLIDGSIPDDLTTLGQRFREAGFATALISGNGFVRDDAGYARGFDVYENPMRQRRPHGAKLLWQSARKFLSRRTKGHAFVMIASSEPHLPYTPSPESMAAEHTRPTARIVPARTADLAEAVRAGTETLTADEQQLVRALYDAEVRDADAAFEEMLADLATLGIAEQTAVILVSDHGQELFERGAFGHGYELYDEIRHIPLAIAGPGISATQVRVNVDLTDVYPTALALAGISANPEIQGENLLPYTRGATAIAPRPVFAVMDNQRAVTIGDLTLIEGKTSELYQTGNENTNVIEKRPIATRLLRIALGLHTEYREEWSRRRWGTELRMTEAFAADHGL